VPIARFIALIDFYQSNWKALENTTISHGSETVQILALFGTVHMYNHVKRIVKCMCMG
jgi:hypothetical protein